MSIINAFDDKTDTILKPELIQHEIENFPKIAILVFKERIIKYIKEKYYMEQIASINAETYIPVYKLKYKDKEFAVVRTLIGGAGTACVAEELIAMGVKKILIHGVCGTLNKDILRGNFVIPTSAYRDEGTSYHYVQPSDFIEINTANELIEIFNKLKIPYITGKTWTTDALYRETKGNMEKRKQQGCIVVEMECASIMAVGLFREIPIYQFLYGDDTLDGEKWDKRKVKNNVRENMEKTIIDISFRVAYEIDL